MKKSLKRRLVLILLGLMLLSWFISASITFVYSSKVLLKQIDRQLELIIDVSISVVRAIKVHEDAEIEAYFESRMQQDGKLYRVTDVGTEKYGMTSAINIFSGDEQIIIGSQTPAFEPPGDKLKTFQRIKVDNETWRVMYDQDPENGIWYAVGVNLNKAEANLRWIFGSLLLPVLILLPLTGLVIYYGTGQGIKPLRQLTDQISERTPESLDPVEMDKCSSYVEVEPLVSSLNNLFARLQRALESEQRLTASAAHEMQTPLAAIKTEVQLCQRMAADENSKAMLARITERVDRASHTVKQLLTLARLDPQLEYSCEDLNLTDLLGQTATELGHIAADRALHIELPETSVVLNANKEAMLILFRNILGNAFKYTTEGGSVAVQLAQGEQIIFTVINDCDPIAPEDVDRLGERFYRPAGSSSIGAGLGLAMVARICELHDGLFTYAYDEAKQQFIVNIRLG